MIKVILDTSVLTADPNQTKPEMRALEALAVAGRCQVIIPEIVKREFLSQREEQIDQKYSAASGRLGDLKRDPSAAAQQQEIEGMISKVEVIHQQVLAGEKKRFDDWIKRTKIQVASLSFGHVKATLDAYFQGKPPFNKRRERNHLPDSLIFEILKNLPEEKNVYVVVNDGNLAGTIKGLGRYTICSNLQEFVTLKVIQEEIAKIETEKEFKKLLPKLTALLREDKKFLKREVKDRISLALGENKFHDSQLPGENGEATIEMDPTIESLELDLDDPQYMGGGILVIPFSGTAQASLSYAIFKSDYYVMDDEDAKGISVTDLNDHYFNAETEESIAFEGYAEISVDKFLEVTKNKEDPEVAELVEDVEIEEVRVA